MSHDRRGLTVLEVLLTLGILGVVTMVGTPIYLGLKNRHEVNTAATILAQTLRRAQMLSQAMDGDTSWGVAIQAGKIILFQGNSYAQRQPAEDEEYLIASGLVVGGLSEVVFTKLTGQTLTTGQISFQGDNYQRLITINDQGIVYF